MTFSVFLDRSPGSRGKGDSLLYGLRLPGDSTEAVPEERLGRWAAKRAAAS
jgi:hypothetical protein